MKGAHLDVRNELFVLKSTVYDHQRTDAHDTLLAKVHFKCITLKFILKCSYSTCVLFPFFAEKRFRTGTRSVPNHFFHGPHCCPPLMTLRSRLLCACAFSSRSAVQWLRQCWCRWGWRWSGKSILATNKTRPCKSPEKWTDHLAQPNCPWALGRRELGRSVRESIQCVCFYLKANLMRLNELCSKASRRRHCNHVDKGNVVGYVKSGCRAKHIDRWLKGLNHLSRDNMLTQTANP